jgi:hypothetical protein
MVRSSVSATGDTPNSTAARWLRSALIGAAALLLLHALSLCALLLPALFHSAQELRDASAGIAPHLALFQLQLAGAVALAGALFGLLAELALLGAGRSSSARVALIALLLLFCWSLRTMAERPALFEDLLWRHGGLAARVQVLVVDRLTARGLDALLALALCCWAAFAVYRRRRAPGPLLRGLAAVAILSGLVAAGALWARPGAARTPRDGPPSWPPTRSGPTASPPREIRARPRRRSTGCARAGSGWTTSSCPSPAPPPPGSRS